MRTNLMAAALVLATTPLLASEVTITWDEGQAQYSGDAVTTCMVFKQGEFTYLSLEAGEEDGPGVVLDFSGDSLDTVMFEFRTEPGWANWTASNSPLYNNHGGGVQVESHITLREGDGLIFDARMIFVGGDAHAEADAVIEVSCD